MHRSTFLILLLGFSLLVGSRTVLAQNGSDRPPLTSSMSYYDVIKLWGPPKEKQEKETKREDVWLYDDTKVVFSAGKVVAWMSLDSTSQGELITSPRSERHSTRTIEGFGDTLNDHSAAPERNEQDVEEILKDIMREPGDGAPPPPQPGNG